MTPAGTCTLIFRPVSVQFPCQTFINSDLFYVSPRNKLFPFVLFRFHNQNIRIISRLTSAIKYSIIHKLEKGRQRKARRGVFTFYTRLVLHIFMVSCMSPESQLSSSHNFWNDNRIYSLSRSSLARNLHQLPALICCLIFTTDDSRNI
jgi:hypothetical protein